MKKVLKVVGVLFALFVVVIVAAVFVLGSQFDSKLLAPDTPFPEITASTDPAVIARGEYLVRSVAHCTQCHGDYPREKPEDNDADVPLSGGFEFAMGPMATLYSANLTSDPETGLGKRTDKEIARAIAAGVLPNGQISIFMRYSAANLSEGDLTAVVSYLRSLPPVKKAIPPPMVTALGKAAFSFMPLDADLAPLPAHVDAANEPSVARGEYLAESVALCVMCHTALDEMTVQAVGPKAGGSLPGPSHGPDSDKEFVAPNLTSDPTGVTGKMSEDQFLARLKQGRAYPSSVMPWENFSRMTESDMRSIYRYLRTLPPVANDTGPTYRDRGWKPAS